MIQAALAVVFFLSSYSSLVLVLVLVFDIDIDRGEINF